MRCVKFSKKSTVAHPNPYLKRREAKLACKKLDVINLYTTKGLKPK